MSTISLSVNKMLMSIIGHVWTNFYMAYDIYTKNIII